jgi:hypothetical protein
MSRFRSLPLTLATLALLAAGAAPALADAPAAGPKMFVVHVENVMPSRIADYEATTKEFLSLVHAHHELAPLFSFTALQGEDLSYAYVGPIRSFADVDAINASFEAMGKAVGEPKWMDLMHRNGQTTASIDERVFVEVPDASYWPAGAKVTPSNARYYEMDFYRVMPGMEDAAAEIAASWKKLYETHNVPYGYNVYRLALGENGPLWLVTIPANDPADLAAMQDAIKKTLGPAFDAQMAKTLAVTRGFEVRRYGVRPDLSLAPLAKSQP